jgi:sigma-B regulation protein RsbU (phosphoserine phosphatase)
MAVVAGIVALVAARAVAGPVDQLAQAGERLAGGDYESKVDIRTGDELQELGDVFNTMGPRLLEHAKMKHSLELAMQIQQNLLPRESPRLEGFDIYGRTQYCDETGGDYFDFLDLARISPTMLGVVVGDVSGHGIPAALLMASARSAFRVHAENAGDDPAAVMTALNQSLVRDTTDESFMTVFYALLDSRERLVHWTAAGHDPALLIRRATGEIELLGMPSLPAGLFANAEYDSGGPVQLGSGDVVVIGTDGIWEARNPAGEMYGRDRLKRELAACRETTAEGIHNAVMASVLKFCAGRDVEDDITLVVIKAL